MRTWRKEGGGVGRIERRISREAGWQIGVGNEELAKGHCVGFARLDDLLRLLMSVFLIHDVDPTELLLELRTKTVRPKILASTQKGQSALAEFTRNVAEGGCRV